MGTNNNNDCYKLNDEAIVILAAGEGNRLWPLTITVPKPLLYVGLKVRMIDFVYKIAQRSCRKIYILTRNTFFNKFQEIFRNQSVILSSPHKNKTGGELISHAHTLCSDGVRVVLVTPSDYYINRIPIREMMKKIKHENFDIVLLACVKKKTGEYLQIRGNNILGITTSIEHGSMSNIGIYSIKTKLLNKFSANVKINTTDMINHLIAQGCNVGYIIYNDYWLDMGNFRNYIVSMIKFNAIKLYENLFN